VLSRLAHRRNQDEPQKVSTLELFYDLVIVFAITQTTHLLIENLTWLGALQASMILLSVWWAWQFTTWVTNEFDANAVPIRLGIIALMMASLIMSIAIPEAFADKALLFAGAYVFIQVGRQSFVTFIGAERGTTERTRSAHILTWFCGAAILWISGALLGGDTQIAFWLAALAIDSLGPRFMFKVPWLESVNADAWKIGAGHFSERCQLFIIIALGESIVLTGSTTSDLDLDLATTVAFAVSFFGTVALWWLYFNFVATVTERSLAAAKDQILVAQDLFVYGHIPIVAGIVLCAVGDELVIAHPTHQLETAALLAVVGGPILYLLAFIPIRHRLTGLFPMKRIWGATSCAVVGLLAPLFELPALIVALLLLGILVTVIVSELMSGEQTATATRDSGQTAVSM